MTETIEVSEQTAAGIEALADELPVREDGGDEAVVAHLVRRVASETEGIDVTLTGHVVNEGASDG